jgi:hypothetical protein
MDTDIPKAISTIIQILLLGPALQPHLDVSLMRKPEVINDSTRGLITRSSSSSSSFHGLGESLVPSSSTVVFLSKNKM